MRLSVFGFWIQRHSDSLDRIALGIGEPDGPLPFEGFIDHFEHQQVQPLVQYDVRHHILIRKKPAQDGRFVDLLPIWGLIDRILALECGMP